MPAKNTPSGLKGNPAHKRMGNAHLKASREASHVRGAKRKVARHEAEAARAATNKVRGMTAWEIACQRRAERRRSV